MRISHLLGFSILVLGIQCVRLDAKDGTDGEFSTRPAIEKRLEVARTELRELTAESSPLLRERLQVLEATCQYHLAATDLLANAKEESKKAHLASSTWKGFTQKPPYSILLLDEIRENRASHENTQRAAEAQVRIFTAEIEAARDKLDGHQQTERRLMDGSEKATAPVSGVSTEQAVKMERIASRATTEKIAQLGLRIEARHTEAQSSKSKKALTDLQLKAIEGKTAFPKSDLDDILQRIARKRSEAAHAIVIASNNPQTSNPLLSWQIEFLDLEKSFWETRFTAFNSKDPSTIRSALTTLKELKNSIDDWIEIAQLRVGGGSVVLSDVDPTQLRDALVSLRQMQRKIGFSIADLEGDHRGTPALDYLKSKLISFWDAELYLVEENEIIDGKLSPIYRPVTIGKLIRLAFILIVGWLVLRLISKKINAMVARRGNIPQTTADLAGKWAFAIGLLLLVVYGMNTVHIPLTALAFLGGALAIGVGFGTQTLLKNFISGIILLFERPLKVGDVIEVAGITGTIKTIGIRASVIQHFDGIETLVPNSILLENQLTNWTFSNTVIRHFILVGVAYGSPTREVARLLLAVAAEHGLVKKDPAPEVRFDNFADNSLTFSLLFWFDTNKTNRGTLGSDLRFMIDKAFEEAGIVISYPQRDIHFDAEKPLRVELSRPPGTAAKDKS
jgi:small-conductance mechanosensitive channel